MTTNDIIDMALRAQFKFPSKSPPEEGAVLLSESALARFAELVAAHEREACAKLAEETVCVRFAAGTHVAAGIAVMGLAAANAIRARSET